MSVKSHRQFYDGAPRPHWAGAVQSVSRQRLTGPNRSTQSTEVSGLVLPVSVTSQASPPAGQSHTFGQSLGLPHLGEQFADVHPDLWKNWGRLEQVLGQAATQVMGWDGPQRPGQASSSAAPDNALQLSAFRRTVKSTNPEDGGQLLGPDSISGEVSKVFAIQDVSGTQRRYESAGSAATFEVTPSSVHWSRDPRTL
jgi:hypothetical protein